MASDVLSTQGVRSSRDMVLTKFAQNIPVSAAEEFISSEVLKQEQFFHTPWNFASMSTTVPIIKFRAQKYAILPLSNVTN